MPLPLTIYLALAAPASELEAKVKAIFEEHCTACHDNGGEEPSLAGAPSRLKSVKSKATGKPMVAAGDPDGSYLLAKINGKNITGDAMPLGGDPLPAAQKSTIKEWIASLAPATVPTPPAAASKPAAQRRVAPTRRPSASRSSSRRSKDLRRPVPVVPRHRQRRHRPRRLARAPAQGDLEGDQEADPRRGRRRQQLPDHEGQRRQGHRGRPDAARRHDAQGRRRDAAPVRGGARRARQGGGHGRRRRSGGGDTAGRGRDGAGRGRARGARGRQAADQAALPRRVPDQPADDERRSVGAPSSFASTTASAASAPSAGPSASTPARTSRTASRTAS
jgi:mono/diheme cytochrome c family protein